MRSYKIGAFCISDDVYTVHRSSIRMQERAGLVLPVSPLMKVITDESAMLIRQHMELYLYAWKLVGHVLSDVLKGSAPDTSLVIGAAKKIDVVCEALEDIAIRPFRRHAACTAVDLHRAVVACIRSRYDQARYYLQRARRGMRWVFLLHRLQKGVLMPLDALLDEAVRRTKPKGMSARQRIKLYRSFDPERCAAMRSRLESFRVKVARCPETDFELWTGASESLKKDIEALVGKAKDAMDAYDWPKALLHLSHAARKL